MTSTITKDDLQVLVTRENADEITELGISFNIMIGKIRELLAAKLREQESLKMAELRALQAQINPHFLYNTLDTIIWMAEAQQTDQVVQLVSALSSFFRISLSKGRDWITIGEEVERTRSYLTIQKMRYRDILDFHIVLTVEDNGVGMTADRLTHVRAQISEDSEEIRLESGFGIDTVNRRIQLAYGRQYGLSIASEYQVGTCVTLVIPAQSEPASQKHLTAVERKQPLAMAAAATP